MTEIQSTRTIEDRELSPGKSTTVTVEATPEEPSDLTIVDRFDPTFYAVEIVDADGADYAAVQDADGKVFATYGDREAVTLVYEVTLPEWPGTEEGDKYAFNGFADSDWNRTAIRGDDAISVVREQLAPDFVRSTRTIADEELKAGESTTVTVEATPEEPSDFTIVGAFDPAFPEVEIVDDDGADFSGVRETNDAVYATYSDREAATLVYEVKHTGASDADVRDRYRFSGSTDNDAPKGAVQLVTEGDDAITVVRGGT